MRALSTSRLTLTPLAREDAAALFDVRGDPKAMAHWDAPPDQNPQATAAVVEHLLEEIASGDATYWTVRLRADGTFAGLCDLSDLRSPGSADVGFMLVRRLWGLGLAREIVACLRDEAHSRGVRRACTRFERRL